MVYPGFTSCDNLRQEGFASCIIAVQNVSGDYVASLRSSVSICAPPPTSTDFATVKLLNNCHYTAFTDR